MARPICLWLSSLTVCALSACGGSETGFFGPVAGAGNSNRAGAPSIAGSTSSAGSPGSAGSAGSPSGGSDQGSAGQEKAGDSSGGAQTGGANSSGGTAGNSVGGRAGAGGRSGTGGGGASAGHAGSNSGSAGTGGANPDSSCTELLKLASQQLEAARVCNVAADSRQCTGSVKTTCNCEVPVQRDASPETNAYLATLKQIKNKDCVQVCPAIACTLVTDAQCKAPGATTAGTCTVSHGPLP